MIGAAQLMIRRYLAERKLGPAVDAQVLPRVDLPGGPPEDEVLPQEAGAPDTPVAQVPGKGDHMPFTDEDGIFNHAHKC